MVDNTVDRHRLSAHRQVAMSWQAVQELSNPSVLQQARVRWGLQRGPEGGIMSRVALACHHPEMICGSQQLALEFTSGRPAAQHSASTLASQEQVATAARGTIPIH